MSCTAARRRLSELPACRLMRNSCRAIHSLQQWQAARPRRSTTDRPLRVCTDTRASQHGVYTLQPVVQPVVRPAAECKRTFTDFSLSLSLSRSLQLLSPICSVKANSHRQARHDKTVLSVSRPLRRCELSRPDRPTSAFGLGVCRAAQALPVRPPDALRRRTHLSGAVGPIQFTPPDTTQDRLVLSSGRCELGIIGRIERVA